MEQGHASLPPFKETAMTRHFLQYNNSNPGSVLSAFIRVPLFLVSLLSKFVISCFLTRFS
ncbi:MAG: hypothetical protein DMG05_15930 [Acidobacteria bacterium]|nr:MAG: hypothetical protein DMG05_15930 [Acidobacteriota bacterium]